MIFAKKNITVRAYDFGYGFQSLVYDNVISVDNVDLYTLMTNTIKYGDKEVQRHNRVYGSERPLSRIGRL